MGTKGRLAILTLAFTALMSVPFLVPHCGWVSLFGIVPLLLMERIAEREGVRHFFWWYYMAFLLWNLATTWWVCNATVAGGLFASAANALQMAVIFALFRIVRKRLPESAAYIFLAAAWICWEHLYFDAEISWPWLVLGNSFARTLTLAQWYEWTGTLGGSLWIWASNLLIFFCLRRYVSLTSVADDESRTSAAPWRRLLLPVSTALVLVVPALASVLMYTGYRERGEETLDVAIAQPNFDPYQKFQSMTQAQQNDVLLRILYGAVPAGKSDALLLIAPETFTSDIDLKAVQASPSWRSFHEFLEKRPGTNLLFGAVTREYFFQRSRPSVLARKLRDGLWVESHNSALMTDATGRTEIFHKSRLVVGVEKTPYPKLFTKIDDMLGGVMGRDIGQDEISLLNVYAPDGTVIPVGCAICYESVYGEYCTGYVRKGARALTVITNDAWWGDTAGYRQHLSYASLRAIETRRDIARCGNTGISAIIDQRGRILKQTPWWEEASLKGTIRLNDSITAFVRYGDVTGRACTALTLLIILASLVWPLKRKS